MTTYAIELYNGYDVTFLSTKTERFIKTLGKARRFQTIEQAEFELAEQKKKLPKEVGSLYVTRIGR